MTALMTPLTRSASRRPSRRPARRPLRWRALVGLAAVAALATGLLATSGAPAQAANLENHTPITYNMQGAQSGDTTPKWSSDIPQLIQGHDVVALQEAGPVPALDPNGLFSYQDSTTVGPYAVYHYLRNFGTSSRPNVQHVYFMQTDPGGNRVNLAMVTVQQADAVWITPPTFPGSRASFGVQLGNTVFNDVHGLSGGGNDIPGMLAAIQANQGDTGHDYAVLGDFNRQPDTLTASQLPADTYRYVPGAATQLSGGQLDYMVANRYVPNYAGHLRADLLRTASDHLPVEFGIVNPQAPGGFSIGSYSAHGDGDRLVDIYRNDSTNGTHVIVFDANGGANQDFTFEPTVDGFSTIRSQSTNKCLDLNNGPLAVAGDYVNEWDCLGQPTQEWALDYWSDDPGATAIVNVSTGLCLDVFQNGTGNGTWTDVWTCNGQDNQKWTLEYLGTSLSPAAVSATAPRALTSAVARPVPTR